MRSFCTLAVLAACLVLSGPASGAWTGPDPLATAFDTGPYGAGDDSLVTFEPGDSLRFVTGCDASQLVVSGCTDSVTVCPIYRTGAGAAFGSYKGPFVGAFRTGADGFPSGTLPNPMGNSPRCSAVPKTFASGAAGWAWECDYNLIGWYVIGIGTGEVYIAWKKPLKTWML